MDLLNFKDLPNDPFVRDGLAPTNKRNAARRYSLRPNKPLIKSAPHSCTLCRKQFRFPATLGSKPQYLRTSSTRSEVKQNRGGGCAWWDMIAFQVDFIELASRLGKLSEPVEGGMSESSNILARITNLTSLLGQPLHTALATFSESPGAPTNLSAEDEKQFIEQRPLAWKKEAILPIDHGLDWHEPVGKSYVGVQLEFDPKEPEQVLLEMALFETQAWRLRKQFFLLADHDAVSRPESVRNGRPINPDPGSDKAFLQMRAWLQGCDPKHSCHAIHPSRSLPGRLLKLEPSTGMVHILCSQDLKKCLTKSDWDNLEYVALSYCWGPNEQYKLVKDKASELAIIGIHSDSEILSRTHRDAIQVTGALGFRYLWIDALCIVQDDQAQSDPELKMMASIYTEAALTIVASRATKAEDGFLSRRSTTWSESAEVCLGEDSFSIDVARSKAHPFRPHKSVILTPRFADERETWATRGWTLQEHLLSRRRLEFGTHRTAWACECRQTRSGDHDGWFYEQQNEHNGDSRLKDVVLATAQEYVNSTPISKSLKELEMDSRGIAPDRSTADLAEWYDLVEAYSARKLTKPYDRLKGISALATVFGSKSGEVYLRGHWESRLAEELSWEAVKISSDLGNQYSIKPSTVPSALATTYGSKSNERRFRNDLDSYMAEFLDWTATEISKISNGMRSTELPSISSPTELPSWSWASYVGAVGWPDVVTKPANCQHYFHIDQHFKLTGTQPTLDTEHPEHKSSVIATEGCELHLQALLAWVPCALEDTTDREISTETTLDTEPAPSLDVKKDGHKEALVNFMKRASISIDAYQATGNQPQQTTGTYLLILGNVEGRAWPLGAHWTTRGLVLLQAEGKHKYSRLGMFTVDLYADTFEDYQDSIKSLWGGASAVREVTLV